MSDEDLTRAVALERLRLAAIVKTVARDLELRLRDTHDKCRGCMHLVGGLESLAIGIVAADGEGNPVDLETVDDEVSPE